MLTAELIDHNIPRLQLTDSVVKAKQLITDYKLSHLPVVSENKFLGLISEEDLLDVEEEKITIEHIQEFFLNVAIPDHIHFLNAINFCNQYESNIVPIVDSTKHFRGVISSITLLKIIGEFAGANEIGGIIIIETEMINFSISEISRIIESNNSTIFHLNTNRDEKTGKLIVTIHINNRELSSIVSTFERFKYTVLYHFGAKEIEDTTDFNYRNLMKYLDL